MRLKKQRERRQRKALNESPTQHERRLERSRQARRNRQVVRAAMAADKFVEEISKVVPRQTKFQSLDFGDHPAISLQKLVVKEEIELFHAPLEMAEEESESSESETEDDYRLNKYKIKCLELQRDIDKTEDALQWEKDKKVGMEREMQKLRRKAIELEDLYGIPII